jgi:hypothetical protein
LRPGHAVTGVEIRSPKRGGFDPNEHDHVAGFDMVAAHSSNGNRRLIGAFGAIAGGAFGSWFTWQKERQSVAAALAGEVEAFVAVTEWYQTREFVSRGYRTQIDDHPFPVFEANVGKIGFLPPDLARDVAGFYSHARRVVEEFLIINKGEPIEGPSRIAMVENFTFMKAKGQDLVPALQKEAKTTWKNYLTTD